MDARIASCGILPPAALIAETNQGSEFIADLRTSRYRGSDISG
jgi:hypothetical protein